MTADRKNFLQGQAKVGRALVSHDTALVIGDHFVTKVVTCWSRSRCIMEVSKRNEDTKMTILSCDNLTKTYGQGETLLTALDGVSFSVQKGEFVAIVGPSGSGKSTLLHLLGGVDRPTAGRVLIGGQDINQFKEDKLAIFRRRHVGLIYQFYNLLPMLTVEENICLPHLLDGRPLDQDRLDTFISYLGLDKHRKHLPNQLSGGQQQRTAIGRALYSHPDILLCDEPTGNLDRKNSEDILRLLKAANRDYQQTIILITHDDRIALEADRLITIEDGRLISDVLLRTKL